MVCVARRCCCLILALNAHAAARQCVGSQAQACLHVLFLLPSRMPCLIPFCGVSCCVHCSYGYVTPGEGDEVMDDEEEEEAEGEQDDGDAGDGAGPSTSKVWPDVCL